jgi:hypothetical protein
MIQLPPQAAERARKAPSNRPLEAMHIDPLTKEETTVQVLSVQRDNAATVIQFQEK